MNVKNASIITLGSMFGAVLSILIIPILTWYFSQEVVAKYSILLILYSFGSVLIGFEMHQAYVREYYEVAQKEQLLKIALVPGTAIFILISLFLILLDISLAEMVFNLKSTFLDFFLLIGVYLTFFINIMMHAVRMHGMAFGFAAIQILPKLLFFALLLVGSFIFKQDGFETLFYLNGIVLIISAIILIIFLKNDFHQAIILKLDKKKFKEMLVFSLPLVIGSLAYWALTSIDRLFLNFLSNYNELSLYAVASTVASGVGILVVVFGSLWHPLIYKWVNEGVDSAKILAVNELMVLFICFVWTVFGLFSWLTDYIFPTTYADVSVLIVGCVAMPLLYLLSETTTIGIGISKKTKYAMLVSLFCLFLNITINYFFVEKYGAKASVIASMLGFCLFLILRTEFSSFLWISLSRWRMYISVFTYIMVTILILFGFLESYVYIVMVWMAALFLVFLLYYKRIIWLINFIGKRYI